MHFRIKQAIFNLLNHDCSHSKASKIIDIFLLILIILNVIMVIVDTFDNLSDTVRNLLSAGENISLAIFTVEYVLRLWTSDLLKQSIMPLRARLRFALSFMAIIDLLSILPFYLPYIFPFDLRALRLLRLIRLLRIFKISRYSDALPHIAAILRNKAPQLISSILVVCILMIIASILMYNIEHEAQPTVFSDAVDGLWWAMATLTTVGYGDIYPITLFGKLLSGFIALLGIALVAIPTGIISTGFIENIDAQNKKKTTEYNYCPHCGRKL